MNSIVKCNYPVSKLPDDLREGADPSATATIIVTFSEPRPDQVLSLEEIFALRRPPYRTKEDIDAEIRRQRDEWDD